MSDNTVTFRDGGVVFTEGVKRPTFIYDKMMYHRVRYGDYEQILKIYNETRETYIKAGFPDMADDLGMIEVPADQELVDNLFQSTGFFNNFIKDIESKEE